MNSRAILIAEDRSEDVDILKMAFGQVDVHAELNFVPDGAEAIAYLSGKGEYANRRRHPFPSLLLLDLKMPRTGGFEVLEWLRSQEDGLRRLPVVVFTSSDDPSDMERAYDLGANSYLVKPMEFKDLEELLRDLGRYWFEMNRHPGMRGAAANALAG